MAIKSPQVHVRDRAMWYVLWLALCLISSGNALAPNPIFSGAAGLLLSLVLAAFAGLQILRGIAFLCHKETVLAAAMLVLFIAAQMGHWLTTTGPRATNSDFDLSAYYLAGKVLSTGPAQGIYHLPLYADGRMNLNAGAPASSSWANAAMRFHVPSAAPFIYPPFFAVLMRPLARLSFSSASIAWRVVTVLFLAGAVRFSLGLGGKRVSGPLVLILSVGAFSYYPIIDGLHIGQIDCFIYLLLAASWWMLAKNRILVSALCFATATLIKLTPVIAVPLLMIHRQWKWLAAYFAWMGALLLFSIWHAGWSMHQQFWHSVLPSISCGAPICQNSSLVGYVQELFLGRVPDALHAPSTLPRYACGVSRFVAAALYCSMLVRFYLKRGDKDPIRDLILMALLGVAISPIAWWHYYTIALLPFIYLWCRKPGRGNGILMTLFILVGTNSVGYFLLLTENPAAQLMLAAIVPCLTIALVYFALGPKVCVTLQASGFASE